MVECFFVDEPVHSTFANAGSRRNTAAGREYRGVVGHRFSGLLVDDRCGHAIACPGVERRIRVTSTVPVGAATQLDHRRRGTVGHPDGEWTGRVFLPHLLPRARRLFEKRESAC